MDIHASLNYVDYAVVGLYILSLLALGFWVSRTRDAKDAGSIVADPMFIDTSKYNFHIKPNSPAIKIGFKPFDYSTAGVYGSEEWRSVAQSLKFRPIEYPPTTK